MTATNLMFWKIDRQDHGLSDMGNFVWQVCTIKTWYRRHLFWNSPIHLEKKYCKMWTIDAIVILSEWTTAQQKVKIMFVRTHSFESRKLQFSRNILYPGDNSWKWNSGIVSLLFCTNSFYLKNSLDARYLVWIESVLLNLEIIFRFNQWICSNISTSLNSFLLNVNCSLAN